MINAYLRDALTIVRHGTRDQWGSEGATTEEAALGYIEWTTRLVRNIKGEEVASSANILLPYDATLTHEDRIKIDGVEHSIITVQLVKDFTTRAMKVFIS
ncbi:MAG: hypothetical protein ABFD80_06655 [Acidobacteriota bacterium]